MNEALRCDRMSMMHAGRVLDSASPAQLIENRQAETLEEAFIGYLIDAGAGTKDQPTDAEANISEVSDNKEIDTTPKNLVCCVYSVLHGVKLWNWHEIPFERPWH